MEVASMTQPDPTNGAHLTSIAMDASMDIDMDIDLGPLPEPESIEIVSDNSPILSACLSLITNVSQPSLGTRDDNSYYSRRLGRSHNG